MDGENNGKPYEQMDEKTTNSWLKIGWKNEPPNQTLNQSATKYHVNRYGCFRKYLYPQIIHFNKVFHYKPPILGYPYVGKHPYIYINIYIIRDNVWE